MKVVRTEIPEVLIFEPSIFEDERGYAFEGYNQRAFREATGLEPTFVQDNISQSVRNVIRGLHYQIVQPQGKLIRALRGEVFDVAVDIRRSSKTFGKWVGFTLSERNHRMAWIPRGFAHGLVATSEIAAVWYKLDDFWAPKYERSIAWNDPAIGIQWPIEGKPILSPRDAAAVRLAAAELFP